MDDETRAAIDDLRREIGSGHQEMAQKMAELTATVNMAIQGDIMDPAARPGLNQRLATAEQELHAVSDDVTKTASKVGRLQTTEDNRAAGNKKLWAGIGTAAGLGGTALGAKILEWIGGGPPPTP